MRLSYLCIYLLFSISFATPSQAQLSLQEIKEREESSKRLEEYVNSPELKKKMEKLKKESQKIRDEIDSVWTPEVEMQFQRDKCIYHKIGTKSIEPLKTEAIIHAESIRALCIAGKYEEAANQTEEYTLKRNSDQEAKVIDECNRKFNVASENIKSDVTPQKLSNDICSKYKVNQPNLFLKIISTVYNVLIQRHL